jgi:hypothetical protein
VRSYSVSDYNAGIQNWSITQDDRGVMYIGNNKGLLEFDGNNWELHELPSKNIVRSVYIGKDGKIFVGSFEEFGYFERNSLDSLVYHSLKDEAKDWNTLYRIKKFDNCMTEKCLENAAVILKQVLEENKFPLYKSENDKLYKKQDGTYRRIKDIYAELAGGE